MACVQQSPFTGHPAQIALAPRVAPESCGSGKNTAVSTPRQAACWIHEPRDGVLITRGWSRRQQRRGGRSPPLLCPGAGPIEARPRVS
jgi:hypothetical protein